MARGKIVLEDSEGRQKKAPIGYSWLMLICGPFYPLLRGQFGHAVLSLLLVLPTIGFSLAVLSVLYQRVCGETPL